VTRLVPVVVLALAALGAPAVRAAEEAAPRAVVAQVTDAALAVLRDKRLGADEKRHRLEDIVYAHTDFATLSRLVLARNWSHFSDAQQREFMEQFRRHLALTYGRNVESYRDETVQITGAREEPGGDWTVQTKIVRGGPDDILVDYRLRRQADGSWKIIDFVIERVSLVANYRSEFQEILSHGGPAELLRLLAEKNAKGELFKAPG
jgi:phospholipid transport system substrate-binding protein